MALSDLLQGCSNKSDTVMINKNVTRLTTQGCNNIVISWLYRTCWNNLATSLIMPSSLLQVDNSLFQTCWQLGTSSANTTCWRLVGRLATRCEIFPCVTTDRDMIVKCYKIIRKSYLFIQCFCSFVFSLLEISWCLKNKKNCCYRAFHSLHVTVTR
jgi:hypothetical protein